MRKEKRGKKGLSPIIATTLLVALVVIIALLIYVWAVYFVGEAIKKTVQGTSMGAEQVCGMVSLDANYQDNVLAVTNDADVPVNSIKIVVYGSDGSSNVITKTGEPIFPGATKEYDDVTGTITKMEIIPVILGEKGQEKKEYSCERYKKIVNIIT